MNVRPVNRVAIVLDKSGSMLPIKKKTLEALNKNIVTIKEQAVQSGQDTTVTLVTFGSRVDQEFFNRPVDSLKELRDDDYRIDGMTALFDAVGQTIERFQAMPDSGEKNVSFLILVITDGAENASSRWNPASLNAEIRRVQQTDRYTLAFLLPQGNKLGFCRQFSVPEGNVQEWETSDKGVEEYSRQTTKGIGSYYAARAAGQSSVKTFYSDMSGVSVKDVKAALDDLSGKVKLWKVEKEADIRDFVEEKSKKPMLKGAAFYELTKDEKKLQSYKQILVMERGKKAIYGGPAARQLLGLPNADVRVKISNHAGFRIFVQSTSTNRKLVRGTEVAYYPAIGVPFKEGPSAKSS